MEAKKLLDSFKSLAEYDSPNLDGLIVPGAKELYSEFFDLRDFFLKQSYWIKLKELKAILFSQEAFTTGRKNLQLNCLSNKGLCEMGPTHVVCSIKNGYNGSDRRDGLRERYHQHYHCSALMPLNLKFDRLKIKCETKLDRKSDEEDKDGETEDNFYPEDLERVLVLKGSCYLNYTLTQVDNGLFVVKIIIAILCFAVALVLMLYTFSNCRSSARSSSRVFFSPLYFTRLSARQFSSANSIYH